MKVLHKCFLIICEETKNVYLQEDLLGVFMVHVLANL